jgi:CubicO group peptidase (beta-lactamase class C family)/fucose 4-O-acetylase-like acetyltransferase
MATQLPVTAPTRNTFLDVVRAVAILRVVVWHTYGYAWISYFIASMPAMFFLAGSLMAYSLRNGGALRVVYRRFKRLLIPFWAVGVLAVAVMLVYDRETLSAAARFDAHHVVWWLVPIWDPTGSEWGLTWWAPLWYVRCLAWLLLTTPLLLWAWRRVGVLLLGAPLLALAYTEALLRADSHVPWQLQDFALYSFFWVLGFAYNDGLLAKLDTRLRATICLVFVGASAVWAITQDVPGNVVNASYPLHLFVGLSWLFGALTVEDWIGKLASRPRVADALYWVNERALTIYLWQAVGLFAMYQILWTSDHAAVWRNLLALPIVASITFLAILLLGWLEDVAAGRQPRLWPTRRREATRRLLRPRLAVASSFAALVIGVSALVIATSNIVNEPSRVVQAGTHTVPPSGVGLHFRAQQAQISGSPAVRRVSDRTGPVTDAELQAELEGWLEQWRLAGATASLLRASGEAWTGASGLQDSEAPFEPYAPYSIASVTKTFTAALILRLSERHLLNLNDKVSKYVPAFPEGKRITVRQLLQHTSGIASGEDLPYLALAQSAFAGLQFEPGKGYLYSRTNYYLLGLIIERIMEKPFAQVLREELIEPLGLALTFMDEDILPLPYSTHPYEVENVGYEGVIWTSGGLHRELAQPRFEYRGILWSAGGLWSNTSDLTRWALALWDGDCVLSRASRQQMTTFLGAEFDYTGLGVYPFCPCWRERGDLQAERWGFVGVTGTLEYDPVDRIAVAVHMSGTILDENVLAALEDFSVRMRYLVRGRQFAAN